MTAPALARPVIGVVDYGAGNLVSIEQALATVGAEVRFVGHADELDAVDALVVPGVGAAGPAMRRLSKARLVDPILRWIDAGRPYLGICLGLQLLFEASDEDGATTFGVLSGRTVTLEGAPTLPHIGWNQVTQRAGHPLFHGIEDDADFYFVHSYAGSADAPLVIGDTTHGATFASAVARHNVLGVQFHPERSGVDGLRLLRNFASFADRSQRSAGRSALVATNVSR
jgi:glutamine amidotransferase